MKKPQNISLIGMPGCGKTTVGMSLSQVLERPFSDIDELIEAAAGKSIPKIFAEDGEDEFRRIETRILSEETGKSGIIIATGGGVVTRPENLGLLRRNGVNVYLERELSELVIDGRPLSESLGVQTLAEQRLPLYKAWSDYIVQVEPSPDRTAARILEAIGRGHSREKAI